LDFIVLIGFIPAVIFPAASILQLIHILKTKSSVGVSALAWIAFALGNVSLFIYTEKYDEIQSIVGTLGTAVVQIGIIIAIFKYRSPRIETNTMRGQ